MKNNYYNKLRELDRTYDFGDFNNGDGNKFTKRRSHRRSRQQIKEENKRELRDMEVANE